MAGKKGQAPRVEFSQAIFDRICLEISLGASLRSICVKDGTPDRKTFHNWRQRTPELQGQYDRACLDREEVYFEQIIEIADDTSHDTIATEHGEQPNSEWITRSRLRVDARKWALARMNRKKYGDSITHSGDADAPVQLILKGSDIHG
jgi:hypothetical protein